MLPVVWWSRRRSCAIRDSSFKLSPRPRTHGPDGNVFVLFAHHVGQDNIDAIDFQSEDAMAYLVTRGLDPPSNFRRRAGLDANNFDGVVPVLAIQGDINSTWEQR